MGTYDHITAAWQQASRDLGFEFVAPFALSGGNRTLHYLGLVTQFGSPKGMLVIVGRYQDDHIRVAQQHGYGYSCFSEDSDPYEPQNFIDVLNDWGWSGSPESAPSWYTEQSWTSDDA